MPESTGAEKLDALLGQVIDGATKDSVAGLLAPYIKDYARRGVDAIADNITGTADKEISVSRYRKHGSNEETAREHRNENITYDGSVNTALDKRYDNATKDVYKALGYSDKEAAEQLDTFAGKAIRKGVEVLDTSAPAYGRVNETISRRYDVMQGEGGGRISTEEKRALTTETLTGLEKDFYKDRKYGSLTMNEASEVMGETIASGRYDTGGDASKRAARIRQDSAGYARAAEGFKSTFDGTAGEVMQQASALYGDSATALTPGKLQQRSQSLQRTTLNTGMHGEQLTQLTRTMYGDVSRVGGDQRTAVAAAQYNAYNLSAGGINVEGLAAEDYEAELAGRSADIVASGKSREIAGTYQMWLRANKMEDTAENVAKFKSEVTDMSDEGLSKQQKKLARKMGFSGKDAEEIIDSVMSDKATRDTATRADFFEMAADNEDSGIKKGFDDIYSKMAKDVGLKNKEDLDKVLGEGWESNTLEDNLSKLSTAKGVSAKKAQKARMNAEDSLSILAAEQGMSEDAMMQYGSTVNRAKQLRETKVEQSEYSRLSGDSKEAISQVMASGGKDTTIGDLVAAGGYSVDLPPDKARAVADKVGRAERAEKLGERTRIGSEVKEGAFLSDGGRMSERSKSEGDVLPWRDISGMPSGDDPTLQEIANILRDIRDR